MFRIMTTKSLDKLTHRFYDAGVSNGFNRGVMFVMKANLQESVREIEVVQEGLATLRDVSQFLRRA